MLIYVRIVCVTAFTFGCVARSVRNRPFSRDSSGANSELNAMKLSLTRLALTNGSTSLKCRLRGSSDKWTIEQFVRKMDELLSG
jgi:hypothetical protein